MDSSLFPKPLSSDNNPPAPSIENKSLPHDEINTGVRKTIQNAEKAAVAAGLSEHPSDHIVPIDHTPPPSAESDAQKTKRKDSGYPWQLSKKCS